VISLLRRISKIAEIHCEENLQIDWPGLLKISEEAKIISDNTYWKEYKRYSGRQKQEMLLGGLFGNVEVQGELNDLMPYMELGELIHVGKSTSFGFGKYEMQIIERE
jgi:CRISPR/Cas system endoribonuclease Cas6 (RAMP superfamily)